MIYLIIGLGFIFLASAMNAVMDIIKHKYRVSIFYRPGAEGLNKDGSPKLNKWESFWNPVVSWYAAKKVLFGFMSLDAWHVFKFLMLTMLSLSVTMACYFGTSEDFSKLVAWLSIPSFSIVWGVGHTTFYHFVLKKSFWEKKK